MLMMMMMVIVFLLQQQQIKRCQKFHLKGPLYREEKQAFAPFA